MLTSKAPGRAYRLAPLIVASWLLLAAMDLVQITGFARMRRLIVRCRVRRPLASAPTQDIVWAVEEACVWYVKRVACLQRSAVTTWMLRRHGTSAHLVIGYRPVPFESHAWVEVDGVVVNDRAQYPKVFTVLDRL